jgi:hypothetical protein
VVTTVVEEETEAAAGDVHPLVATEAEVNLLKIRIMI